MSSSKKIKAVKKMYRKQIMTQQRKYDELARRLGGETTTKQRLEETLRALRQNLEYVTSLNGKDPSKTIALGAYSTNIPQKKLISVDGTNGSGKSDLIRDIGAALEHAGYKNYEIIKESTLSPLLQDARESAKKKEEYESLEDREYTIGAIVTAGRRLEGRSRLLHRLRDPGILILDRYFWTTLAYQLSTNTPFIEAINLIVKSYILPDAAIILTCKPEIARERSAHRYHETRDLDIGKPMENIEDLTRKTAGFEKLVGLVNQNPPVRHYDTTNLTRQDLDKLVINDVLTKFIDEETKIECWNLYKENMSHQTL